MRNVFVAAITFAVIFAVSGSAQPVGQPKPQPPTTPCREKRDRAPVGGKDTAQPFAGTVVITYLDPGDKKENHYKADQYNGELPAGERVEIVLKAGDRLWLEKGKAGQVSYIVVCD